MKFKVILFTVLAITGYSLFAQDGGVEEEKKDHNEWIYQYINIDPSDDLYYEFELKRQPPKEEYVKNLVWNQDIDFFIEDVDEYNLRKNVNALPRFPYVFMLYGGTSYKRSAEGGFLFRADNIGNTGLAYTSAISYGLKSPLWIHNNIEYPGFLDGRLKVIGTASFFSTAPAFAAHKMRYSQINSYSTDNSLEKLGTYVVKFLNKVWSKLNQEFYRQSETGFHIMGGVDFRVPFLELDVIPRVHFAYKYEDVRDVTNLGKRTIYGYPKYPDLVDVHQHNFGANLGLDLRWNKLKQTKTVPVGFYMGFSSMFYLPTMIGLPNNTFRFKTRVEGKYTKKIYKEVIAKARVQMALNYNISEDFSGDPNIRGMSEQELTGWFALLMNVEALVPIVDVNMYAAGGRDFMRDAKFVVYLALFGDLGFGIDNYDYYLDGSYDRLEQYQIRNSLHRGDIEGQLAIGSGHYFLPGTTVGTGIRIHSYFLHFSMRFDVAFNIIKAAVYASGDGNYGNQRSLQGTEFVGVIFSFSEMF